MPISSKPQGFVARYAAELALVTIVLAGTAILTVKGAPGRAIQRWQNSAGTVVAEVGSGGVIDAAGFTVAGVPVSGGVTQAAGDARYVNAAGDTMTGALKVRANLSGSTLSVDAGAKFFAFDGCTSLETDADGDLVCGTDAVGSGGGVTGTGSTNELAYFTGPNALSGADILFGIDPGQGNPQLSASGLTIVADNGNGFYLYGQENTPVYLESSDPGFTNYSYIDLRPNIAEIYTDGYTSFSNGNVGIGAGNPQAKLEVAGAMSGANIWNDGLLMSTGSTLPVSVSTSTKVIASTAAETSLGTDHTIDVSKLKAGDVYHLYASGTGTEVSGGGLVFTIKLAGKKVTYAAGEGWFTFGAASDWYIDAYLTFNSTGTASVVKGNLLYADNCGPMCTYVTNGTGGTFNMSTNQPIGLYADFVTSAADNSISVLQYHVSKLSK